MRPGRALEDRVVRELPELLREGDQIVVNDTRVIPASLHGRRIGRGPRDRHRGDADQAARRLALTAFAKPGKRLQAGDIVRFGEEGQGVLPRPARRR